MRIFLDFETFWDRKTYTLSTLSPVEYILHSRWETLATAVAIEHEAPFLLPQDEIAAFLLNIKQPYAVITHNALFDACVLAYRYGIHPDALFCTLSMCRAGLLHEIPNGRLSLKNISKFLMLQPKGELMTSGMHWADIVKDPGVLMAFTGYAINDVEACREIFFRLRKDFPAQEARVMDRIIRMATQPRLHVDVVALNDYRQKVRQRKEDLLTKTIVSDPTILSSNNKFADLLREYGVEPPTKISPATGREAYAFAKTDHAFTDLLEHDDIEVQALVAARLGFKTTIEETRSTRLINIGLCANDFLSAPLLPCPLKYSGAHTHRFSGDWRLNMQNLSARKSKAIRSCIHAPPGYTIVAVDAAQIEARLVAWIAGQRNLLEYFVNGQDTYRAFAADVFHVDDVEDVTKFQRFIGKTCILGLGFGVGVDKLRHTIVSGAREQGFDNPVSLDDCQYFVKHYRTVFRDINKCWYDLNVLIQAMARGNGDGWTIGPCRVEGTTIILPSGLKLYYDNLRLEDYDYFYDYGQYKKKLYGAKVLENVVQALDRQHVMEAGLRTEDRAKALGIDGRVLLNIHDENVHCVPDEQALTLASIALEEMKRNSVWAAGLPLNAEVKLGKNFGELSEWKSES